MTHRQYLASIAAVAIIALTTLGIVVFRMDPFTATALSVPFFFGSLFLSITTIFALTGFYGRVWVSRGEVFFHHITVALRQGALLALAILSMLGLQIFRILTWWDALLIIAAVFLIELYFLSTD